LQDFLRAFNNGVRRWLVSALNLSLPILLKNTTQGGVLEERFRMPRACSLFVEELRRSRSHNDIQAEVLKNSGQV
jgi:hypothetical protein